MNWAAIFWLVLLVVCLAVEAATVTLVSLWFAAGSLLALLAGILGGSAGVQAAVFLVTSAISLAALRPVAKKFIHPKVTATNSDAVIGSTGLVTVSVDNVTATGQVKLGAMTWSARSTSGAPIPEGTLVKADRIEGVKVFVSPVEIPAGVSR